MREPLYLVGTGTFAAEIIDWAGAAGAEVAGLVEPIDPGRVGRTIHGLKVRAPADRPPGPARAVLAAGGDRRALWAPLAEAGWEAATIVHPSAVVAADATLEPGVVVGPQAVIGAQTTIGAHAIVNRGALVGHHVEVGPYAVLNPGVNVGGLTVLGAGVFLGMGAIVANGRRVGEGAVVGAGAVAVRDVSGGARVRGIPAREWDA